MIKSWEFPSDVSEATALLMDSLRLGLQNVEKSYGETYIQIKE